MLSREEPGLAAHVSPLRGHEIPLAVAIAMHTAADHPRSRLHSAAAQYREARHSLHMPASAQSRRGLDWMNFFIADVQTGFGTFVAFYLAELGWSQASVGVALAAGGIAGVVSQIPGGALADAVTWKRGLAALGILMTAAAALLLALKPNFVSVFLAQILQGATAGIITPAIGAISLGLVGRARHVGAHRPQLPLCGRRPCLDRRADGRRRRLLREQRDLHRRGAVVRACADRAQLHPQRGDRLRQSAQCRARQTRGRRGARRRPRAKIASSSCSRARRCCSNWPMLRCCH